MNTAMWLSAAGIVYLTAYCLLLGRLLPRQRIPGHYQLLAWLGILATASAVCFAMAAFLTE